MCGLLTIKYTIFAIISIFFNILFQWIVLKLYKGQFNIYFAIGAGTLVGLVIKYFLDKNYIFYHKTETFLDNTWKFILYSFMGIFTTIIFWGIELSFHFLFRTPKAKYIGAIIGLTIGYYIKYQLDKRFVFTHGGVK